MGTWGIFIGWMAMFELISEWELEPYWKVLSIFLPLALLQPCYAVINQGKKPINYLLCLYASRFTNTQMHFLGHF